MGMFKFNGSGLQKFSRELGKLPKLIEQAEAMTLNNMAFKFKEEASDSIIENFTSRKPAFVRSSFRVEKATRGSMTAVSGSIALSKNNTGFTEMLGEAETRGRVPTLFARGNNAANTIPKKNRLAPGVNFPGAQDADEIPSMFTMLYQSGAAQSGGGFVIRGNNTPFAPGLYRFEKPRAGKTAKERFPIKMVQRFEKPQKAPRKFDWIAAGLSKITDDFVNEAHTKNLDYLAKKLLKKVFK
jgi:hypothetical protein